MSDGFAQTRGRRLHLAVDILAPRGSPVVAVDDGTLVRLSSSVPSIPTRSGPDPAAAARSSRRSGFSGAPG